MELVLGLVILGIVAVVIILIMLTSGWRPDADNEKAAWKRVPEHIKGKLFIVPCLLFGFALWAGGVNEKTASTVTICLVFLVAVALLFWFYRDRNRLPGILDPVTCSSGG